MLFRSALVKYSLISLIVVLMIVPSNSVFASSDELIEECFTFSDPVFSSEVQDGVLYDVIEVEGCELNGLAGEALLPMYAVELLIPYGYEVSDVEVTAGSVELVGEDVNVLPAPYQFSFATGEIISDEIVQESSDSGRWHSVVGSYRFRGYELLYVNLFPVILEEGNVLFASELVVEVECSPTEVSENFRGLLKDRQLVLDRTSRTSSVSSYPMMQSTPVDESYDMLILTVDDFADGFLPLKEEHESQGLSVEIMTLSDINPLLPNRVSADDIRDFIREQYQEHSISYVLLGGDADVVPAKMLYVKAQPGTEDTMPVDLFFGCLDGPFNYDGDELAGESHDGEDGGDVDLVAEVYVGRAPVDSVSDVSNFVEKTLTYLQSGGYSGGEVLMVGEYLWSDPDTWGGDYMDELIDFVDEHNYETYGLPSEQYTFTEVYDRDWEGNSWPASALIDEINEGVGIVNHLGHSYYGYNMKMVNSDVEDRFVNDQPTFIYSQGCMAGGFDDPDGYDCIAEYFTVKTEYGAFAVIMNARYGFGSVGSTNGASQRFHREFWDAIFGEEVASIGMANHDSKEDNIRRIYGNCVRWCMYETNLFGDPALSFVAFDNDAPTQPHTPEGDTRGVPGDQFNFSVYGADPNQDEIYYKLDFGNGDMSDWLGPYSSGELVNVSYVYHEYGRFSVRVKTRDIYRGESEWSESLRVRLPWWWEFEAIHDIVYWLEETLPFLFGLV